MKRLTLLLAAIPVSLANLGAHCDGSPRFKPYQQGQAVCEVPGFTPQCPSGTRLEVRRSGSRECEIACRDASRRYHGPYGRYYRYSYGASLIEIGAFQLGRRHGTFRTTHVPRPRSGGVRLVNETSYRAGKLQGTLRQIRGGMLISLSTYRHGLLHGRYATWQHPSGQLTYSHHYRDGHLHGPWIQRRGHVLIKGAYRDGLPHGHFIVVSASGKQVGTFDFEDGRGAWKRFLLDGTVIESTEMRFGMKHGAYRTYHPDGSLSQLGQYHRNSADGLWCTYNQRGAVMYSRPMRGGGGTNNPDDVRRCEQLRGQQRQARPATAGQQQQQQQQQQQRPAASSSRGGSSS